jgi:hypothetical protein
VEVCRSFLWDSQPSRLLFSSSVFTQQPETLVACAWNPSYAEGKIWRILEASQSGQKVTETTFGPISWAWWHVFVIPGM